MKFSSTLVFSALVAVGSVSAQAASLSVSNINDGQDGSSFVLLDGSGMQLDTGFIAIYEFELGSVPTDAGSIQANGTLGSLGLVSLVAGNRPEQGAVFATLDITFTDINALYIVIGDSTSVASASSLGLVKASDLVLQSGGGGAETLGTYEVNVAADVGVGTIGSGTFDYTSFGRASYFSNSLTLSAVPEPSSALFLGIGFLAAGARRRR